MNRRPGSPVLARWAPQGAGGALGRWRGPVGRHLGLLVGRLLREPSCFEAGSLFLSGVSRLRAVLFEQSLFPEQSFGSLTGLFCFAGHWLRVRLAPSLRAPP